MSGERFADVVTSPATRARYEDAGLWTDDTLAGKLLMHADGRADRVAVVDELGSYTFARLASDAMALAGELSNRGVAAGDVVSIQLPNRYEFVVCAAAAQALGCVTNPLLPNYRANELQTVFGVARPAVVVTPAAYRGFDHVGLVTSMGYDGLHLVVGADGSLPSPALALDEVVRAGSSHPLAASDVAAVRAADVSEVIFTSGTEARPKAVMHTEQTANFSVRVAHDDLGMSDEDVVWMPSPLGHSTGFNYGMRFAVHHGLPLVLQDRWDPERAAELIERHRCSYTLAATTFLSDLVGHAARSSADLSSMVRFGCGGAAVPPSLVDAAADVGVEVLRLYGSTEVLVATWNRPGSSTEQRRDTDGTAMSHVEVDVDPTGDVQPVANAGEIVVRGPNTAVGFYQDPERTARTFTPDGWVRSGDVGVMSPDGYLGVVGRLKEIIIRGGVNIAPREIEDIIRGFDEVAAVAIVGVPDDRLGERACACIVPAPGATLDLGTITDRLRAMGVATYKLPERLELLEEMPTTASGKIQKPILLRRILDASDQEVRTDG